MTVDVQTEYPILRPVSRSNPQLVYEQMRERDSIYCAESDHGGHRVWFFLSYSDVVRVLKDERFTKDVGSLPEEHRRKYGAADSDPTGGCLSRHLLNLDPPDHTRLRSLVHHAFTRRKVETMIQRIERIADGLLDQIAEDGGDLLDEFAYPLPIMVIAELLGVDARDGDQFREWTRAILYGATREESGGAMVEFTQYVNQLIDDRYAEDRGDVLSVLVRAEERGDRLSRSELLSMCFLLLVAGYETAANLIGNGMLALFQHPAQMERLRNEPRLMGSAVEEILRWNGPIETLSERWASEDVQMGEVTIPLGDVIRPSLLAANRDPRVFEKPNVFDITRDPNPHIAFGRGIHHCIGAPLARIEGAIAIRKLLARFPKLQLDTPVDRLEWNPSLLIHGMRSLPVRYR